MILEVELLYAGSRQTLIPESLLRLNKEQLLDHCFTCILKECLGTFGFEIQIPSTISPMKTSWEVIGRGQNRYVEELPQLLQRKPNLLLQR